MQKPGGDTRVRPFRNAELFTDAGKSVFPAIQMEMRPSLLCYLFFFIYAPEVLRR